MLGVIYSQRTLFSYDYVKGHLTNMFLKQKFTITKIVKPYNDEYFRVVSREKMT